MNQNVETAPTAMWTEEVLYQEGDAFFRALGESIVEAKTSILLETYIFGQDEVGLRILNLLADAAGRGIRVQLLIDGVGSAFWTFDQAMEWRKKGIEIRFFHPLPWQNRNTRIWEYFNLKQWRVRFSLFSQRNHSKVCIIDECKVFLGSMNISVCHSTESKVPAWRDTSVLIAGSGMQPFLTKFRSEWANYKKHINLYRRSKLNYDKKQDLYHELLNHFDQAEKRIWLTTPYFSPNIRLIKNLCARASSGVDVRLLFPKKSDVWAVKYAMESFYDLLLDSGVKIYEYTPSILHAKVSIVDDWVTVGSTNLDHQSLFYNLEADVALSRFENIEQTQKQFLVDLEKSTQVISERWSKRPLFSRAMEKVFKSFIKIF